MRPSHGIAAISLLTALGSASIAQAQDKWPSRPIRMVVPFSAGGGTDIMARRLGARLTPLLGQQMIIDNKAGGGGSIGTAEVARAKPDGYTLVLGTSSTHTIVPLTMDNPPYDAVRSFAPVTLIGIGPYLIAVHPSVAHSVPELIKRVKANPGKYSYGSTGVGGMVHLTGELFKKQAGNLDIVHVPYKGTGQGIQDLIGGQIPILISAVSSSLAQHRAGKLRILALFSEKRSKAAPDIPTANEVGMHGMLAYTINVVCAPAGTPQSIIDQLYKAIMTVADDAFQKDLDNAGIELVTDSNPEKALQTIKDEIAKWGPIVRTTDMKGG